MYTEYKTAVSVCSCKSRNTRAVTTDVCVRQGERGLDLQTGDRIFEVSDYSFNFLLRGVLPLICLCDFVFFTFRYSYRMNILMRLYHLLPLRGSVCPLCPWNRTFCLLNQLVC